MTLSNAWCALSEIAASQHGVFDRTQAGEVGLTSRPLRRAVQAGRLRTPLSDVFAFVSHPATWRQRLMALSRIGGVASHRSAAALHRFDRFADGCLEVTFDRARPRRLPPNVNSHRWTALADDDDITVVDGIDCSTPARTLVDLAQVLPRSRVEPALDCALRSGVTVAEIDAMIDRLWRPGPTGLGPLRLLLHDPARSGEVPDSLFERLLERIVVCDGIPAPCRQFEVETSSGVRRLDLAWPMARIGVEAHSKRFHFGRQPEQDDNDRDLELAAAGWEVLYVTWNMAHNPDFFLGHLHSVLSRRLPAQNSQPGSGS